MSDLLANIQRLILRGQVNISDHGYDEIAEDGLFVRGLVSSAKKAIIVEEYPDYTKGPCILVFQEDREGQPVHVVWGFQKERLYQQSLLQPIGLTQNVGKKAF